MDGVCSVAPVISAQLVFVRVRGSCQVAVGPVVFVGPVGAAAAVVLLGGRGALLLVRAGLDVAAVVFRHLRNNREGGAEIQFFPR